MEGFMEQITIKPDLKGFPNRSFGKSRKLQVRSNNVNKYIEVEKETNKW